MGIVAHLSSKNITVQLILYPDGVVFNISTVPLTSVTFNSSTAVQLTLLYSTLYNVSIVPTLCGQTGTITSIQLEYGECTPSSHFDVPVMLIIFIKVVNCGYPKITDGSVTLVNFSDPALRGTSVTFSCSEDLILTGPDSAICMDNGQWEPDPREVKCKGTYYYENY